MPKRSRATADVLVLCYHAVSGTWDDALAVEPDKLEWQVKLLLSRGYRAATFRDAAVHVGSSPTFAVTFDDAFRSTFVNGFPVLERLRVPATVFAPTSFIGRDEPMSWPGIDHWVGGPDERELIPMTWTELDTVAAAGWEVGSHTLSHPRLPELEDHDLDFELRQSRRLLGERLGRPCETLAYPYGAFDDRVVAATRAAGYLAACTLPSNLPRPTSLEWSRIGIYRADDRRSFSLKVSRTVRLLRRSPAWGAAARLRDIVHP